MSGVTIEISSPIENSVVESWRSTVALAKSMLKKGDFGVEGQDWVVRPAGTDSPNKLVIINVWFLNPRKAMIFKLAWI